MKIATFWWAGRRHVGRLSADGRDLKTLALGDRAHAVGALALVEAMAAGATGASFPKETGPALPVSAVKLDAPLPVPRRNIFCVGINYRAHASEFAASGFGNDQPDPQQAVPDHPVIFSKVPECVIAPEAPIRMPEGLSSSIDYEAELAVIIGKDGKGIKPEEARDYVFGYTILNDYSSRNLQMRHTQWYLGKSLDGHTPMGPCIVTADEFSYPPKLRIRSLVNGEVRQDSTTDMLIYDIDYIIADLSAGMTLKAGTVISTGTPKGVGMGFDPPKFLKAGDVVTCEIEGIGTLTNPICD